MKNLSNTEAELKKSVAYKKRACNVTIDSLRHVIHRKPSECLLNVEFSSSVHVQRQ